MRPCRSPAVPLAAVALLASACVSDIDTSRIRPGVPVATYRGAGVAFSGFRTFAIVGRIPPITGTAATPGLFFDAPLALGAIAAALEARGYQQVATVDPASPPASPVAADLAVNVSALEPLDAEAADFWVASAAHLGPSAWGFAGSSWSYPWSWLPMGIRSGTLLVEIADLRGATAPGPVGVAWAFLAYGASTEGGAYDTPAVLECIDRAFAQSPYLDAQGAP